MLLEDSRTIFIVSYENQSCNAHINEQKTTNFTSIVRSAELVTSC